MPSVLLTGANAFLAAHIINSLIQASYHITGTVRRAAAADAIFSSHPEWKDHLKIVVVEDIANEASWDATFKAASFDHVIHVAAPLLDNPKNTDYDRDFFKPSVQGNLALLRSAQKHAPTVKSVVVTGSINACTTGSPEEQSQGPITNETWLPITPDDARALNNAYISYCSGKKEGEQAIWDFVKTNKPSFSVTVLLPALIFGPPIEPLDDGVKHLHFSSGLVYGLFDGSNATVPRTAFPSYIDARDLADAHVKALTEPKAANKRFTIGGQPVTFTAIVRVLATLPELRNRLPAESGEDLTLTAADIRADEGNTALSMNFRSFEDTITDTARRILELEGT